MGNLAWWTSDKDLSEAIQSLGVTDLIEIKFYENKVNGQSKGFALVTAGSDQSFRTLMDKLPKKELNGQEPIVTHFSRHYFNQFEEQARKDMPPQAGNNNSNENMHYTHSNNNNSSIINNGNLAGQHYHNNAHHPGPQTHFQQQQQQQMMSMLLNSICLPRVHFFLYSL